MVTRCSAGAAAALDAVLNDARLLCLTSNMNDVRVGVTEDVDLDYCHKIDGVYMYPASVSVSPDVQGAQGRWISRPPEA